jgi:hypothetical protein
MAMIFGIKELIKPDDWANVVGKENYVPKHSAFELAQSWQGKKGNFPPSVQKAFDESRIKDLQDLKFQYAIVEHPIFLDTFKAPSRTDLMVYCQNANSEWAIIGVEGKAEETFGDPLIQWTRDCKTFSPNNTEPLPSRLNRLNFLNGLLGISFDPNSSVRYQLIHRTASIILEAIRQSAKTAVLLIHSFGDTKGHNWKDFIQFLSFFRITGNEKNVVMGPTVINSTTLFSINLFFLWVQDTVKSE